MEVTMNTFYLYLFLGTLLGAATLGITLNNLQKPVATTPFTGSKQAHTLFIERKAVHDQSLANVKNEFAISDADWNASMNNFNAFVKTDDLMGSGDLGIHPGDPEIVVYTKKALAEYGINPEKVTIELVSNGNAFCAMQKLAKDDMNYSPDNRIMHSIQLDLEKINTYDVDVQHAFVRHEIMHLLHYDSIEAAYVLTLLHELGYTPKEYNQRQSMIDYRYQRELRADVLATCQDTAMAQELDKYFQKVIANRPNDISSHSHPPYKMRHEQLAQLLPQQPQLA